MSRREKRRQDPFKPPSHSKYYITGGQQIGGYVSLEIVDYLHLLALHHGTTMQDTLGSVIEKHAEQEPESAILSSLTDRAVQEWVRRLKEGRMVVGQSEEYLDEVEGVLRKRKLSEGHTSAVLVKLKKKVLSTRTKKGKGK